VWLGWPLLATTLCVGNIMAAASSSSLGRPRDTDAPKTAFSGIMIVDVIEAIGLVPPAAG
jgi:hypothetical protein